MLILPTKPGSQVIVTALSGNWTGEEDAAYTSVRTNQGEARVSIKSFDEFGAALDLTSGVLTGDWRISKRQYLYNKASMPASEGYVSTF